MKYGKLSLTAIRELRQLRDENARLKCLVADLTLDKHILGQRSIAGAGRRISRYCAYLSVSSRMLGHGSATNASTYCCGGRDG